MRELVISAGRRNPLLDHDDELMPHALETLAGLLEAHPEARAAYADHVYSNTAAGVHFPDHHYAQPAFARLHRIRPRRVTPSASKRSS